MKNQKDYSWLLELGGMCSVGLLLLLVLCGVVFYLNNIPRGDCARAPDGHCWKPGEDQKAIIDQWNKDHTAIEESKTTKCFIEPFAFIFGGNVECT